MAKDWRVDWYGSRFEAAMDRVTDETLDRAAAQCLGHARVNIQTNDQIDTGFMWNSGYMVSAKQSTYGETQAAGAGGRERAAEVRIGRRESATAFAAKYAIYQELHRSYLYRALTQTVAEFGGIVSAAGKEALG